MYLIIFTVLLVNLISESHSGVTLTSSLYDPDDKVFEVRSEHFKSSVHNQRYATLVEFYNYFCGHCKRFVPHYKQVAESVWPWRNVVKVMAVNCADEDNNDICRYYEIMEYPTLRYFPPFYEEEKENLGDPVSTFQFQSDKIVQHLANIIANETDVDDLWPNFRPLTVSSRTRLWRRASSNVSYIFLVFEPMNSTVGIETILQFTTYPEVALRRIKSKAIAEKFALENHNEIAVVDKNKRVVKIRADSDALEDLIAAIKSFLKRRNIQHDSEKTSGSHTTPNLAGDMQGNELIIHIVKTSGAKVYLADLKNAIHNILFNEIPKIKEINGARLVALQQFVHALERYSPLGQKGKSFLQNLHNYVTSRNDAIQGNDFEQNVKQLEEDHYPLLSANPRWIGCVASKPIYRGYTCGLWQLFHYMTVTAASNNDTTNPAEVLQAIHGYVKYFFGCTDCSQHFQDMAARRNIFQQSDKESAILWLWEAHNEVNQRLAGDSTEDPEFPKVQYPLKEDCHSCYDANLQWDKSHVLKFLKRIYDPENISAYGMNITGEFGEEKPREKRMVSNVFSEVDMRMGVLLYIFCIGMMAVAIKFFLYRGYRKKPYTHEFFGKI